MSKIKINFGCGGNLLPGWINCDIVQHHPDIQLQDIRKKLPWEDNSVAAVFTEHCLEHVSGPEALAFLDEVFRILEPGGTIRVCVPCIDKAPFQHARDLIFNHGHLIFFSKESLYIVIALAGFERINFVERDRALDGHWKVIGEEKDRMETRRIVAFKPIT